MASLTKGDIVQSAFSSLGMGGELVALTNPDYSMALQAMEEMIRSWEQRDIYIGYNFTEIPSLNDRHRVDRMHWDTMYYNLALDISPNFDIDPSRELMIQARASMDATMTTLSRMTITEVPYARRMPTGAANELRYLHFYRYYPIIEPLQKELNFYQNLFYPGDINIYSMDFSDYLTAGEHIENYTIETETGLTLLNSAESDGIIEYSIRSDEDHSGDVKVSVKITIETNEGRVEIRTRSFTVIDHILIADALISSDIAPVLPLNILRLMSPEVIIMADTRVPYVPIGSPFADIEARDVWAENNLSRLLNSTTRVTVVYVDGNDEGAFTEWQWNGADNPASYDRSANQWINILTLSPTQVRALYERNYVSPFNSLDAKSNIQLRPINGSSGLQRIGTRNFLQGTGFSLWGAGTRAEVLAGTNTFHSINYDVTGETPILHVYKGDSEDAIFINHLIAGSLIELRRITVVATQADDGGNNSISSVVVDEDAWRRLVITEQPSDTSAQTISFPVIQIAAGTDAADLTEIPVTVQASSGGGQTKAALGSGVNNLIAMASDLNYDRVVASLSTHGSQVTERVVVNNRDIVLIDAGKVLVFDPENVDPPYNMFMTRSAGNAGFGVIVYNDADTELKINAPVGLLLGAVVGISILPKGAIRLIGLPEKNNAFTGWAHFAYEGSVIENGIDIRRQYESNFLQPYGTLANKKNAVYHVFSLFLQYEGDSRLDSNVAITSSSDEGAIGLSRDVRDTSSTLLEIRLDSAVDIFLFRQLRPGDQLEFLPENQGTANQFRVPLRAEFVVSGLLIRKSDQNNVFQIAVQRALGGTQGLIEGAGDSTQLRMGVSFDYAHDAISKIGQGFRSVKRVPVNETEMLIQDTGSILLFDYLPSTADHNFRLPVLTQRDEGWSIIVSNELPNNVILKPRQLGRTLPDIVVIKDHNAIIAWDGRDFLVLESSGLPAADQVDDLYAENYVAPYNKLDSKQNAVFSYHFLQFSYVPSPLLTGGIDLDSFPDQSFTFQTSRSGVHSLTFRSATYAIRNWLLDLKNGDLIRLARHGDQTKYQEYQVDARPEVNMVNHPVRSGARIRGDLVEIDVSDTRRTDDILDPDASIPTIIGVCRSLTEYRELGRAAKSFNEQLNYGSNASETRDIDPLDAGKWLFFFDSQISQSKQIYNLPNPNPTADDRGLTFFVDNQFSGVENIIQFDGLNGETFDLDLDEKAMIIWNGNKWDIARWTSTVGSRGGRAIDDPDVQREFIDKRNIVFHSYPLSLRYKGDEQINSALKVNTSDAIGVFGLEFNTMEQQRKLRVRVNSVLDIRVLRAVYIGDVFRVFIVRAAENYIEYEVTGYSASVQEGVLFSMVEVERGGTTEVLDASLGFALGFRFSATLAASDTRKLVLGERTIIKYGQSHTRISSDDAGRIISVEGLTGDKDILPPSLSGSRDSGWSTELLNQTNFTVTIPVSVSGAIQRFPIPPSAHALIYYDGSRMHVPVFGSGNGEHTREQYERNFVAPYNTLDAKANTIFHPETIAFTQLAPASAVDTALDGRIGIAAINPLNQVDIWGLVIYLDFGNAIDRNLRRSRVGRYIRITRTNGDPWQLTAWLASHVTRASRTDEHLEGANSYDFFLKGAILLNDNDLDTGDTLEIAVEEDPYAPSGEIREVADKANVIYSTDSHNLSWTARAAEVTTDTPLGTHHTTFTFAESTDIEKVTGQVIARLDPTKPTQQSVLSAKSGSYLKFTHSTFEYQGWVDSNINLLATGLYQINLTDVTFLRITNTALKLGDVFAVRYQVNPFDVQTTGGGENVLLVNREIRVIGQPSQNTLLKEDLGKLIINLQPAMTVDNLSAHNLIHLPSLVGGDIGWHTQLYNKAPAYIHVRTPETQLFNNRTREISMTPFAVHDYIFDGSDYILSRVDPGNRAESEYHYVDDGSDTRTITVTNSGAITPVLGEDGSMHQGRFTTVIDNGFAYNHSNGQYVLVVADANEVEFDVTASIVFTSTSTQSIGLRFNRGVPTNQQGGSTGLTFDNAIGPDRLMRVASQNRANQVELNARTRLSSGQGVGIEFFKRNTGGKWRGNSNASANISIYDVIFHIREIG